MGQNRLIEHPAVFKGPSHQFGVVDRGTVIAEGDGARLHQLADLRQLLSLAVAADARHHKHIAGVGSNRLLMDKFHGGLRVDGRLGVGDAGHAREATRQGRLRAGGDCFGLLTPRLPQMDMHVDQAGRHNQSGGGERLIG